jgi:hypothetical protein
MITAYLLCLGDLDALLESQTTLGDPFLFIFQTREVLPTNASVLGLIIVILGAYSTAGALASSSGNAMVISQEIAGSLSGHTLPG